VVEDNPVNQQVLTLLLEKAGHRVTVVGNGREAVERLPGQPFDLVLMDVQMPEMDGVRATKLIRQREKAVGGHIPIVAVTANAIQSERQRCLAAGMDDYLPKPIRAAELFALIDRLVGSRAAGFIAGDGSVATAGAGQPTWLTSLQSLGFDHEAIHRLVRTFVETVPGRLAALRRAVAAGDPALLAGMAHTLKGSLAVFAVRSAHLAAAGLEALGRQSDLGGAEAALRELTAEVQALLASMRERLQKWDGNGGGAVEDVIQGS
jgi:CheY-like chemotaxis protein